LNGLWETVVRVVVPIVLSVVVGLTGYFGGVVIRNDKRLDIADKTHITFERAVEMIRSHEIAGPHPDAMSRGDVRELVTSAIAQLEARMQIRYEQIAATLTEIKAALKELRK